MRLALPDNCQANQLFKLLRPSSFGVLLHFVNAQKAIRCLDIEQQRVWLELIARENNQIDVAILQNPGVDENAVRARLQNLFGCDQPTQAARAALMQDEHLEPLVESLPPHTIIQGDTLFETLFIAILGQQISVSAASSQRRRVMSAFGPSITVDGNTIYGLPAPQRLIDCNDADFKTLGISRQKARYLRESAHWYLQGQLNPDDYAGLSDTQAMQRIQEIPGVGRWTAQIVLMRSLNRPDIFPAADIGLQNMAQKIYGMQIRPNEQELMTLSEAWAGWRSYAALYLWLACQG